MKNKMFLFLLVTGALTTVSFAKEYHTLPTSINDSRNVEHKINGYKYLCMEQQGNLHDLEDKFNDFFGSIGFIIVTPDEEEELSDEERLYVLYGSYVYNTVPNALDNMTLTLRNINGKIIFSSTTEAACFISVKRCANKASDKIIKQIKDLNYTFDPEMIKKNKDGKKQTETTDDSAKKEKINLARQMNADGMTIEQIEKYTGLTSEEIEKIIK